MKELIKNIASEFNMNLYFIASFGSAIAAYYPIAEYIIKNQNLNVPITKETIVLCIISAFSIMYKEMETDKLKKYIKENDLSDIVDYFVQSLKSFKNIYEYLTTFKSVRFLTDTLSYTTILAPFMLVISDIINNKSMTVDEIIGCGMSIGVGVMTLTIKNIIKLIWNKFSKKIKNNEMGNNILNYEEFVLNETKKHAKRKSNISDAEYVSGGVKYKNEIFPGVNVPKRYVGKGKHKWRVLAKDGVQVKPINFGNKEKSEKPVTKLSKKYWENIPSYK